jgi:hypothetical protein
MTLVFLTDGIGACERWGALQSRIGFLATPPLGASNSVTDVLNAGQDTRPNRAPPLRRQHREISDNGCWTNKSLVLLRPRALYRIVDDVRLCRDFNQRLPSCSRALEVHSERRFFRKCPLKKNGLQIANSREIGFPDRSL